MKHGRTYYTVRAIVRAIMWTTLTAIALGTVYFVLVTIAILEQESWK